MQDRLRMKDIAYSVIKNKIINNEFESGEYLEEKMLCDLVGVSRTPIREAINQLEKDGFVTVQPKKGIFVTTLDVSKANDLFEARKYIEPIVVNLAYEYIDLEEIQHFKDITLEYIAEEDFKGINELDYEFHNYLHSCCPNKILKDFANNIQDQFQRVRTLSYHDQERILGGAKEHLMIIDDLVAADLEKLSIDLRNHIESTQKFYYMSFIR